MHTCHDLLVTCIFPLHFDVFCFYQYGFSASAKLKKHAFAIFRDFFSLHLHGLSPFAVKGVICSVRK